MEPVHKKFTDLLMTKRLQTLQSVDDAIEKVCSSFLIQCSSTLHFVTRFFFPIFIGAYLPTYLYTYEWIVRINRKHEIQVLFLGCRIVQIWISASSYSQYLYMYLFFLIIFCFVFFSLTLRTAGLSCSKILLTTIIIKKT